jgi:mannose-1-phosphate guanylyltransferase/mannose-6-phosphate isomerase
MCRTKFLPGIFLSVTNNVQPVVRCGGSETRPWPLSRLTLPKQFLSLSGSESIFQKTLLRLHEVDSLGFDRNPTFGVANSTYRYLIYDQVAACILKFLKEMSK